MFFCGCIFIPDKPELPVEKFEDKLNLHQIVAGTAAEFNFNNYRELFEYSDTLYCDAYGVKYPTNDFISRLNAICADTSVECTWSFNAAGEFISISVPAVLNVRVYKIASKNFSNELEGEARITIKYAGAPGWQIVNWREVGERYSYFHPSLGNSVNN
jgi:hypothetical protein